MTRQADVTIKALKVRAVRVPMTTPHQTAGAVITESPLVLTDLVTDQGIVGSSITFTYTPAALKPTAELISNIESLVVGEPLAPLDLAAKLSKRFRLLGTQGLVGMALAAVDMAAWDAVARTHNLPLVTLLGGKRRPIPAYGPIGYDGVKESAKTAEALAKQGFTGVKAKIGYPSVNQDIAVIRAIRQAAGAEMAVMVDYNQSLSPVEAVQRIAALEDEQLTWIEEPTLAHDYAAHGAIVRASRTPVQCGENWWGILDMQHSLEAGGSDYVMPDVMKIGGVTGWLKAAALAEARGIKQSNHLWPELSARLLCCTATAHWLEYCDWWNPVLKNPLKLQDGMALVDDTAGSGIEWNDSAVEHYAI